jgi:serine phosphatase RsbU (regulator of sigma subunit)
MKYSLIILFICLPFVNYTQDLGVNRTLIDSLLIELKNAKNELNSFEIKSQLGEYYLNIDNKKALDYATQSYKYSIKTNTIELRKESTYTLAHVYNGKGFYDQAIEHFIESDTLCRQTNDTIGMLLSQNGLGNLQIGAHHYDQALFHYTAANQLARVIKDTFRIVVTYIGMGTATSKLGHHKRGLDYYSLAKSMYGKEKSPFIYASILTNMSECYTAIGTLDKALAYSLEGLEIMTELNHGYGLATLNQIIGDIYKQQNKYATALSYYSKAIAKNKEIGAFDGLQICYLLTAEMQEKMGNKGLGFDYLKKHLSLKDSLFDEKKSQIIAEMQSKYNQEISNNKILLLNKENQIRTTELKGKENQHLFLYGGLGIVLIFSGFIFNRYKIAHKQKIIIEVANTTLNQTNHELGIQRDEILASITYAKRIQNAILPTDNFFKSHFKESFILYKPKDIVAGDFYWLEEKNDKLFFAVADCTGHGVPGAMVSVICNNALNRSVREYGISSPNAILDMSTKIVIEEFGKSDEDVMDGMDIALCSIDGKTLSYAGAHNPLWIIRDNKIIETKGDKQPIGKYYKRTPYVLHTFELQKNDIIYLFTDGYTDQFGGEKGKKFKIQAFRELLLSIHDKPMAVQNTILNKTFENYRGSAEQIDDVCVIGIRI